MYGNEGYKYLTCPYDPNHIIKSYRFPYHIRKCKKNHPDVKLENCVYNFNHLIKPEDFLDHLETCPNKCRIESNCYHDSSLEHESCVNEIYDAKAESDEYEESFQLVKPLEIRSRVEEKLEYLALQEKKLNCGVSSIRSTDAGSHSGSQVSSKLLLLDEDLPPLQLPKTTSKAFQIKK